jgi:hypothetical protein
LAYVNTTFFPKTNYIKDFASRLAARIQKGRVYQAVASLFSDATLDLNFAATKTLDPKVTFTRASTGTYVDANGVIQSAAVNEARFDHDPTTGESLGLLIEEARTNLVIHSEFKNGLTDPTTISAGLLTATSFSGLFDNTGIAFGHNGSTASYVYVSGAIASTTTTFSCFIRMTDGGAPVFSTGTPTDSTNEFTIILAGQTTSPNSYTVEDYGNGLYRVWVTGTSGTVSNNTGLIKYTSNSSRTFTVSGYQIESGVSFPSSYIPTNGATATRAVDLAEITGTNFSSWYNQSEGTVFSETKGKVTSGGGRDVVDISDGSGSGNRILLRDHQLFIIDSSSIQTNIIFTDTLNNTKTAAAFTLNDAVIYSDGANEGTDTSLTLPTVDRIHIGSYNGGGEQLCGCIYRLTYFPERLPDATLQAITQ